MLCLLLLILLLLLAAYFQYHRNKRNLSSRFKNNRLSSLPFIGIAHHFFGTNEDIMKAMIKIGEETIKNGGILWDWMLNDIYVAIVNPHDAEVVLRRALNKVIFGDVLTDIIGNGTLIAKVPIWRPRRKIMTLVFSQKNLDDFVNIFSAQAEVMAKNLQDITDKGSFSIWNYATSYAMDAIFESTLGTKVNAQNNPNNKFLVAFDEGSKMLASRLMQPWLQFEFIFRMWPWYKRYYENVKTVQTFVRQTIVSKRTQVEQNKEKDLSDEQPNKFKSFLELLIETSGGKNGYTDQELQEELISLALAGIDTSSAGISFILVLLSQYADVQEKVYQELQEVFGDSDRRIVAEDLKHLKYLEAVIKESLRLYSPIPITSRLVEEEITLPSGLNLVKGTGVSILIWSLHRNPNYWGEDADEFRPERFYNTTLKYPGAFIPFGDGTRNCIGRKYAMMSITTVVATLLRRYKLLPSRNIPLYDPQNPTKRLPLRTKYCVSTKHADNFELEIVKRRP